MTHPNDEPTLEATAPGAATKQPAFNPVERLADEFARRCRAGENPSVSEYAQKHPELAKEIRELFPVVRMLGQAGSTLPVTSDLPVEVSGTALSVGVRLGRYTILAQLGAGGMGEVYRAKDQRLDRDVAVKVLPLSLGHDPRRLTRFDREARAVAALSHPNILAIHDYGTDRGVTFAVMELLEGETLRQRITRSPLPWREALAIGIAVADALTAAHARAIVHRDLKPENLFLTTDGRVKVLDFGLARAGESASPADGQTQPHTPILTQPGAILGTAGYMSPEQIRGQLADPGTDIFALGCVLFEMVSGRRAFDRPTHADVLAATLYDDLPDPWGGPGRVPQRLKRLIRHCVEKDPAVRFGPARELAIALRAVLADKEFTAPARPSESGAQAGAKRADDLRKTRPVAGSRRPLASRRRRDDETWRLYLEGRYQWDKRTEAGLRQSIAAFRRALDTDASHALSWAGLADAYHLLGVWGHAPPTSACPKAKAAALRAIELDDSLVEAHAALAGVLKDYDWDFLGAERCYRRALELSPSHARSHQWYGECLACMGRHDEAITQLRLAQDLDPLSTITAAVLGRHGYFHARRYDQALQQLSGTTQTDPSFWIGHFFLGWVFLFQGRSEQALTEFETARQLDDNPEPLVGLGYASAVSSKPARARQYLAALMELADRRYVAPVNVALVFIGLKENDQAFLWLDKACDHHSNWLSEIRVDPAFDPVRADPRFPRLLARMNIVL